MSLRASRSWVELNVGDTVALTARTLDAYRNAVSPAPSLQSVDPGTADLVVDSTPPADPIPETRLLIVGTGYGTTRLAAAAGSLSDTVTTVVSFPADMEIVGADTVFIGSALQLQIQFFDHMGNGIVPRAGAVPVTWESRSRYYATVDDQGRVTGTREGTAYIIARLRNGVADTARFPVLPDPFNELAVRRQ